MGAQSIGFTTHPMSLGLYADVLDDLKIAEVYECNRAHADTI